MSRDDNGSVSELFAAAAQDWAASEGVDRVIFAPLSLDSEATIRCALFCPRPNYSEQTVS